MEKESIFKQYELYEILSVASEWAENPEDKDAQAALSNILNSLVVRDYMPLKLKENCLKRALIDIKSNEFSGSVLASQYEISIFFNCLLPYIVNLNIEIDGLFKDYEFYDLLHICGLTEYILSFCKKDYEVLVHMAERMISFENMKDLSTIIDKASPDAINQLIDEFKKFKTDTSPEMLKTYGDILASGDPMFKRAKDAIETGAYNAVIKQMSEDDEN